MNAFPEVNPRLRAYWLGWVDPRPLALFRIALGLVLLLDLVDRSRDLEDFFTDRGILPLDSAGALRFTIFSVSDHPGVVWALFALGAIATVAFFLGWHARVAAAATWLFFLSFFHRDSLCDDGGDGLVRVLLFFAAFAGVGATMSIDMRSRPKRLVPALPQRILEVLLAALYLAVARNKIKGGWLSGDVLYQILQLRGFARPGAGILLQHPSICTIVDHATWMTELVIPLLALSPWKVRPARIACLFASVGLQIGIGLGMRVGVFQQAVIAASLLWVPPEWLDRLASALSPRDGATRDPGPWSRARAILHGFLEPPDGPPADPPQEGRQTAANILRRGLSVALLGQAAWVGVSPFVARRAPRVLNDELEALGIWLPSDLFSRRIPVFRWRATGNLVDGSPVADVLEVARPETVMNSGWIFSRWIKFTYKSDDEIRWPQFGAYLCRRWAARAGADRGSPLAGFTLSRDAHPPTVHGREGDPFDATDPFKTKVLLRWSCLPRASE